MFTQVPLALLALALPLTTDRVTIQVPDQAVKLELELPGFRAEPGMSDGKRILLGGQFDEGMNVSVLCDVNFPYLSSAECRERYKGTPGLESFQVGDIAACKYAQDLRGVVTTTTYYGWINTPDYVFTIHLSKTGSTKDKSKAGAFQKADFVKLLQSAKVTGEAKRDMLPYPSAVYAVRDEAAAHSATQLDWVTDLASERSDDYAVHLYLGALAYHHEKRELALRGYERAAELLLANGGRGTKETQTLFVALDTCAGVLASQKRFQQALVPCQRLAEVCEKSDHPKAANFRHSALFNIAICYAQTGKALEAVATLEQLLALDPTFKENAQKNELLAPLRARKDFKALVGN